MADKIMMKIVCMLYENSRTPAGVMRFEGCVRPAEGPYSKHTAHFYTQLKFQGATIVESVVLRVAGSTNCQFFSTCVFFGIARVRYFVIEDNPKS